MSAGPFAPRRPMLPGTRAKRMTVRFPSQLAAVGFFHSRFVVDGDLTTNVVDVFRVRGRDEDLDALIAAGGGEVQP